MLYLGACAVTVLYVGVCAVSVLYLGVRAVTMLYLGVCAVSVLYLGGCSQLCHLVGRLGLHRLAGLDDYTLSWCLPLQLHLDWLELLGCELNLFKQESSHETHCPMIKGIIHQKIKCAHKNVFINRKQYPGNKSNERQKLVQNQLIFTGVSWESTR